MFFVNCSLLGVFCTEIIIRKKNGQVLNKPQMRQLLKKPGGTFLQIQKDILTRKTCPCQSEDNKAEEMAEVAE